LSCNSLQNQSNSGANFREVKISIRLTTTVSGSEPSEAAQQAPDSEPEFFQESPQARAL